ncbi:hypothetical protein ACRAWG_36735 [Methylobacterium sp. P31]
MLRAYAHRTGNRCSPHSPDEGIGSGWPASTMEASDFARARDCSVILGRGLNSGIYGLVRFTSTLALVGTAALMSCGPVLAASDITMAAITTGRLYVVGTTEHPHTPVTLDDRFTTESDDTGKFQYELVYHPARCIVSAIIEGKAHEAVVTNCGQQCQPGPEKPGAPSPSAAVAPHLPAAAQSAGKPAPAGAAARLQTNPPVQPPPARTGAVTPPSTVKTKPAAKQPAHTPPQKAAQHATPQAKPAQPPKPSRKPHPPAADNPDDAEPPIAD